MNKHTTVREVTGPWSLTISRAFWEGFTPAALRDQAGDGALRTVGYPVPSGMLVE